MPMMLATGRLLEQLEGEFHFLIVFGKLGFRLRHKL